MDIEHTKEEQVASFDDVKMVVENEERFKARIGAGSIDVCIAANQ